MKLELQNAKLRFLFFFSFEITSSPPWTPNHSFYFFLRSGGGWSGTQWEMPVTWVCLKLPTSKTQRTESIWGWCCRKMAGSEFWGLIKMYSPTLLSQQYLCYYRAHRAAQEGHHKDSTHWDLSVMNTQSRYHVDLILCTKGCFSLLSFLDIFFRTDLDIGLS